MSLDNLVQAHYQRVLHDVLKKAPGSPDWNFIRIKFVEYVLNLTDRIPFLKNQTNSFEIRCRCLSTKNRELQLLIEEAINVARHYE